MTFNYVPVILAFRTFRDLEKGSSDIVALVILIYSRFIIVMMQINTIQYEARSYDVSLTSIPL